MVFLKLGTSRNLLTNSPFRYISRRLAWPSTSFATSMSTSRDISPPPTKRRRVEEQPDERLASEDKSHGTISVYSWNINGITPFIQQSITSFFSSSSSAKAAKSKANGIPPASLRDFLCRQDWPTVLCLQEVKISPTDLTTQHAVQHAVRSPSSHKQDGPKVDEEPCYTPFFTLPTDPHNATGFGRKVHGVCTLVRTDFLSSTKASHRTVPWDLEGRVSILDVPASTIFPSPLSIWNIYAVNGTDAPYKNNKGVVVGTRHQRKRDFHRLLLKDVLELEKKGVKVVLAGDMNVARDERDGFPNLRVWPREHVENRRDFCEKFLQGGGGESAGFGGLDTWRSVHGEERRGYTYYPRGRPWGVSCDRVDMVICSASLKEHIVDAGILETPADRGPSDHCPLYATLDLRRDDNKKRKLNNDYDDKKV